MPPKRGGSDLSAVDRKRSRVRNARTILTQQADLSVNDGKLDMPSFLHAREQEIRNMDIAMQKSRAVGKQRQFQKLPRELRRRTASHNVNRVPGNRRARAAKEMMDDNTPLVPTKKKLRKYLRVKERALHQSLVKAKSELEAELSSSVNKDGEKKEFDLNIHMAPTARFNKANTNALAPPPSGKTKYQHRQRKKTWLPTHVWHAKRAHLAEKWGFSIVTEPSLKAYRATHRSSTRTGAVAWDASYYATFILTGAQNVLEESLQKLTNNDFGKYEVIDNSYFDYDAVVDGKISWEGMAYEDTGAMLAPILLVWKKDSGNERRALIRCHPSASIRLVNALNNLRKLHNNQFDFHDYRFMLGSIDIVGPESTEALTSVLKIKPEHDDSSSTRELLANLSKLWNRLGNVSNISSLPNNIILSLNCADPRLSYPPQYTRDECKYDFSEMITNWPHDTLVNPTIMSTYGTVFDQDEINKSYINQPTQKSIDKRRARETEPGIDNTKLPYKDSDPIFPVLLVKRQNNFWTVILPWGWVLPVWYSLQHHRNVRVGGLNQRHQLDFEASRLYFPKDFPGTVSGDIAANQEAESAFQAWSRKPSSKRVAYDRVHVHGRDNPRGEIGSPFRCDWKYLWMLHSHSLEGKELENFLQAQKDNAFSDPQDMEVASFGKKTSVTETKKEYVKKTVISDLSKPVEEKPVESDDRETDTTMEEAQTEHSLDSSKKLPSSRQSEAYISKVLSEEHETAAHHYVTFSKYDTTISHVSGSQNKSNGTSTSTSPTATTFKPLLLKPVSLKCVTRGTPEDGARIYKIPPAEYKKWMQLTSNNSHQSKTKGTLYPTNNGFSMQNDKTVVSSLKSILNTKNNNNNNNNNAANTNDEPEYDDNYPSCPPEKYLIGYITTGSFNLKEAQGTGVGAVLATAVEHPLKRIGGSHRTSSGNSQKSQYCVVRNVGSQIARLAKFEEIPLV